jgi:RNA polymerase sigma-70 factor, ECF subfamily
MAATTISQGAFEDTRLIEMAVAGQTEHFSVLMNRHVNSVKSCIRSMVKDTSEIEDLVQSTFVKAWLNLSTFRFEANFRTWITSIARNEALGFYRRQRCSPSYAESSNLEALRASTESPEQALTRSEASRTVRSAIATLPGKYKQILTLCDLEELTAPETAGRMKSTVSAVKTRRFRARRMLSAALKKEASTCGSKLRRLCK